jgi:REP element-mobilizing transposase RayT
MNRGGCGRSVFFDDDDRVEFGYRLADAHQRFGIVVLAYCLMTNHFHLLLHCPDGQLSAGMQRIMSIYTRHINDRHGFDGALFRGRFHSRMISDDRYLLNACRYIHRNALDLPGVGDVAGYRWSSHRTYLGYRTRPDWMNTDTVLGRFGSVDDFQAFVTAADGGAPTGSAADRIGAAVEAARLVLAEIATESGNEDLGSLLTSATLAVFEGSETISVQELAATLGIPSVSAMRMARSRSRRAVASSPALIDVVRNVKALTGEV